MMAGVKMMIDAGLDNRNTLIAATSLCLGVGVTQVDGFFDYLPSIIGEIFAGNMVAGVFVVGLIMELLLPKDPAKYEAYVEKGIDGIGLDPALLRDQKKEN
jgi:NCS2 family nucleobase:cation symporter-2